MMTQNEKLAAIAARCEEGMAKDPVFSQLTDLRESDLLRVINGSYIAERFFGKSRSWFSQKMNHHLKNGSPAGFTPEERAKLADALRTLSIELDELADELE